MPMDANMAKRWAQRAADYDRIHQALYSDCTEMFCVARSRLVRIVMRERSLGTLANDTFEQLISAASNPAMRNTVFGFFQVPPPKDAVDAAEPAPPCFSEILSLPA